MSVTLDAGNVVIGTANQTGILIAPVGTTAPTTVTEDWGAGWQTLGLLDDEAGVTLSKEVESQIISAWQSKAPVRIIITGKSLTMSFTMIELTPLSAGVFMGEEAPVGTDDEFTLVVSSDSAATEYALGLDIRDGDVVARIIFGRANLSENGDVDIDKASAIGLPVTMSALDDDGVLATIIKGSAVVGS